MTDIYNWGGGTNTPDPITNAKLNQTSAHFTERIDRESALGKQFSQNHETTVSAALQFGYYGGIVSPSSGPIEVAGDVLTLTPSATNRVELDPATGDIASNTSGWTEGLIPLFQVITNGSSILSVTEFRTWASLGGGSVVDASASVKGVVKLSVAPVSPTAPIAVGDNDTRMTNARTPSGGAGGVLSGSYPNPGFAVDMANQAELDAHTGAAAPHTGHFDIDGSKALTGVPDFGGFEATNAAPGTTPNSLATVSQVDAAASGYKDLENVKAMAASNVTKSGLSAMDTVTLVDGDRVLLIGQTTGSENGPWVVHAGAWTRPADFTGGDTPDAGTRVFVVNGAAYQGSSWTLITAGATVGTDALQWTQTGAAGSGEANTASNAGTGTGLLFKIKSGLNLVFKSLKAGSSRVSVVNNVDDVTVDVVEANIDKNALGGSALTVTKGGTGLATVAKGSIPYASAADTLAALAPNGTSTPKFLRQTDDGTPVWAAITVAGYAGTSTSSVSLGTGSKAFTTQAGLGYSPGQRLRASSQIDPTKYIEGLVDSYSDTALVITSDAFNGSGSPSLWSINIASDPVGAGVVVVPPTNPKYDLVATAAPAGVTYAVTVNGGSSENVSITPGDSANTVRTALEALTGIVTAVVSGTTNALGAGIDQTGSGTPSASSTLGGFPSSNAFDNNTATSWAANAALPARLSYDFGSGNAKIINYHSITPVLNAGIANNNAPKSVELYGSNVASPSADETDWTLLDSHSWTWSALTSIGWTFSNTTPYRHMRHKYLVMNVNGTNCQVAEAEFGINAATSDGTYHVEVTNPAGSALLVTTSDTGWSASSIQTGSVGSNGVVTPPDKKNLNSIEAAVSASSLGTLSKKIEVFDASGNSLGFVPVYATIT